MLTELEGSPKQISWALRIRTDKINRWMKTTSEIFKEIESHLKKETKASWWIAHKDEELGGILKYIQGGGGSTGKALVKPKTSPLTPYSITKTYVATDEDGGITRYVGELRDAVTGEVVDDPECPF